MPDFPASTGLEGDERTGSAHAADRTVNQREFLRPTHRRYLYLCREHQRRSAG